MENAYIHIRSGVGVSSFVGGEVVTCIIDLSICVDIDGAVASSLSQALQSPRNKCGKLNDILWH